MCARASLYLCPCTLVCVCTFTLVPLVRVPRCAHVSTSARVSLSVPQRVRLCTLACGRRRGGEIERGPCLVGGQRPAEATAWETVQDSLSNPTTSGTGFLGLRSGNGSRIWGITQTPSTAHVSCKGKGTQLCADAGMRWPVAVVQVPGGCIRVPGPQWGLQRLDLNRANLRPDCSPFFESNNWALMAFSFLETLVMF